MRIELKQIQKKYQDILVFENLHLKINKPGFYFLHGESGSGKTTLLNIIAGYESIDLGERIINTHDSIACIFQSYELIDELSVKDNLFIYQNIMHPSQDTYAQLIIETLGINTFLNRYPNELSGGEKQRVGIARALLLNPDIIVCDEPTESLDIDNKIIVMDLLKQIAKNKIVIVASHEVEILKKYYDVRLEIINHKIEVEEDNRIIDNVKTNKTVEKVDVKKVKKYLSKITNRRTYIYSLILCFLILLQLVLSQSCIQIFKEEEQVSSFNQDVIYMNINNNDKQGVSYYTNQEFIEQAQLQIPFNVWKYEDKNYRVNVFSYISDTQNLKVIGSKVPLDKNIIINQFTASTLIEHKNCSLEELIGTQIELSYSIGSKDYPLSFTIAGIVYEESVFGKMQIYYDGNALAALLKNTEYTDKQSQYDYIKENTFYYALQIKDKDETKQIYERWTRKNLNIYHSIYSQVRQLDNEKQMYLFVFRSVQVIIAFITFIFIAFYAIKETRKQFKNFSILCSLHIPVSLIKRLFMIKKCLFMLCISIISFIEVYVYQGLFQDSFNNIKVMILYCLLLMFTYLMLLFIILIRFKTTAIYDVLKDSKD